jgi:serine/threonine protein kinase
MASIHIGRLLGPVGFSRTVAIKRMHEHYARDPEFVAMFLDEARIAARIRHPNVVSTLDVVAIENEIFLVMDYIQGESLASLLKLLKVRQQRIPLPILSKIVSEVLMGLHAAHEAHNEQGEPLLIVHRDISPHNILIGTDGVARVLDFGIAKAVGRMAQTREGQIKGKLQYMAPEQINGKPASRTADIYAVGIVLWEAVSGRRLFKAENDVEAMYQILEQEPERLLAIAPDTPPALDELVARALQKNPADRFQTARDMALALDQATSTTSSGVVGDWVQQLAGSQLQQRNKTIARIESEHTPSGLSSDALLALPSAIAAARQSGHAFESHGPTVADAPPIPQASANTATSPRSRLAAVVLLGIFSAFLSGLAVRKLLTLETPTTLAAASASGARKEARSGSAEPLPSDPPQATASAPQATASTPLQATGSAAPGSSPTPRAGKTAPPSTRPPTPHSTAPVYQRD